MRWHSDTFIDWRVQVGRWKLRLDWRKPDSLMGRFGGGWQWKVGIQVGGRSVILNVLVFTIRISRERPE